MQLQDYIKTNAKITKEKGFDTSNHTLQLLLIVDEIVEAMEELEGIEKLDPEIKVIYLSLKHLMEYFRDIRKNKLVHDNTKIKDTVHFIEELSDIFIRLMSYVDQFNGMRFEKAILDKMDYNKTRPIRHGKKF